MKEIFKIKPINPISMHYYKNGNREIKLDLKSTENKEFIKHLLTKKNDIASNKYALYINKNNILKIKNIIECSWLFVEMPYYINSVSFADYIMKNDTTCIVKITWSDKCYN